MDHQTDMDTRIWDYIDGLATPAESAETVNLLITAPEWKARYDELLQMAGLLRAAEPEQASMRFTKNVLEAIATLTPAPAIGSYVNKWLVRGVAAFFAGMLAVVYYILLRTPGAMPALHHFSLPQMNALSRVQLPAFLHDSLFWTCFAMINIMAALLLIDTIRRQKMREVNAGL